MPPFSVLAANLAVFQSDRFGSGDQLVDAWLGDFQLRSDFPDGITLQLLHLKRSRNTGVFRVHQCLNAIVLIFRNDLLVHRSATDRLVSGFDETIPTDDRGLPLVLVGAGGAGDGVRAFDECLPLAGDHASDAGIPARVLGVQIAPLVFGEGSVIRFEEVHRHFVAPVEVERSTIAPGDAVIVKVCLILDFDRRVEQDCSVRSDAGVMPECRLRRDVGVVRRLFLL